MTATGLAWRNAKGYRRRGYPCARMRCHTTCFSSSVMNTQLDTSMAVRPQPRQISSNKVEQTATQGESVAVKACCDASAQTASGALPPFGGVLLMRRSLPSAVRPFLEGPAGVADSAGRPRRPQRNSLAARSEEHTSELQSLMSISYAVFRLKKKKTI